ncbi:MAG TPA: Tol-Pal system beta propeller repeat protein TolB [Steroidobacteraceae bacterium]|nr:Tol-Pal system beta propeller repeat protein TolB [Steroidobacteraceae bacterium]
MTDPRRFLALLGLLAGLGPCAAPASAQLTVQITRGVTTPIPVAIVPFGAENLVPVDVAAVIDADLARSGRFQGLPRTSMLQHPTSAIGLDLAQWRLLKTDFIVIGRVAPASGSYRVEFELYNVVTGERLLGYGVPAAADGLRLAAHRAADLIYEKILGVPGAFATRIAYVNVQGPIGARRWRLVIADADGENAQVVLESRQPIMSPAWSPDGARLAYVSFEGQMSAIYVQTLATGARERVSARAGINGAPAFSPDGRRLALALSQADGNVDVFVLDLATHSMLRITDDPAIDTEPNWAPDGLSLFFTSDRAGRPQVYRITLAPGERPKRVTFEGSYNARPRVSPDGTQIAVVTLDQGAYRIAAVDLATGRSRVLSNGHLDEGPSFAPNGQIVLYAAREAGRGVLATVAVDGSVTSRISAADGDVREPAWSPRIGSP